MSEDIQNKAQSNAEDEALINALRAQKYAGSAFDALVLKYQNRVFNLCYRYLGNYEEANDCAQETFVKVYRSIDKFRQDSSFATWLYRIAVNTCKNKFMSLEYRYKKKTISLDSPSSNSENDCPLEVRDDSNNAAYEIEKREKEQLIQFAIDSLPEDQRSVVLLRDVEGLSYEQIAKVTGFNLGTVKSKLSRARAALQEKLRGMI